MLNHDWLQIAFFWNVTQYSLVNRYQYFRETCSLHLHFYSEDACSSSSKTLVPTNQTTQQHIAEDCNLNIHCENLKSPDWLDFLQSSPIVSAASLIEVCLLLSLCAACHREESHDSLWTWQQDKEKIPVFMPFLICLSAECERALYVICSDSPSQ